jgi:hypothetical protein
VILFKYTKIKMQAEDKKKLGSSEEKGKTRNKG